MGLLSGVTARHPALLRAGLVVFVTVTSLVVVSPGASARSGLPAPRFTTFSAGISPGGITGLGLVQGGDGAMWYLLNAGGVGRLGPDGSVVEYTQGLGTNPCLAGSAGIAPDVIAADGAGSLWIGAYTTLGRVGFDGLITLGPCVPTTLDLGRGTAPDGSVWFTQDAGFVRLNPATRTVTSVPVIGAHPRIALPYGLAFGRDGSMWFAQDGAPLPEEPTQPLYLGRWKNGRVTAFTRGLGAGRRVDPLGIGPRTVIAGPDGRMWYSARNVIGASTLDGRITRYTVNRGHSNDNSSRDINYIAAGADGNVWFTQLPDVVGRVTPAGQIARYHTGVQRLRAIATGPGRTVWAASTDYDRPAIVRVALPTTTCQVPDLRGLGRAAAAMLAKQAHCTIGRVRTRRSRSRSRCTVVISQAPRSSTVRGDRARIDLVLGRHGAGR